MSTDEQQPQLRSLREDPYAHALAGGSGGLYMRRLGGGRLPSEVDRWCAAADAGDISVLERCEGAVLDIGCGPGRLVTALRGLGRLALGIDISRAAVLRTEVTGGVALCRSVFEELPSEGRWKSALLMDGNIGIGGAPQALLERVGALVIPTGGLLFVETTAADVDQQMYARFEDGTGRAGAPFPWARVGIPALRRKASATGWLTTDQWTVNGRHFLELRRDGHGARAPRAGASIPR